MAKRAYLGCGVTTGTFIFVVNSHNNAVFDLPWYKRVDHDSFTK